MTKLARHKIGFYAGLATAVLLTAGSFVSANAETVGEAAPNFSVVDSFGEVRTLDEFQGKRVVLEWTNKGCPFVKKHYDEPRQNMQGLQSEYALDDAVWLTVISSAPGKQGYMRATEANAHADAVGAAHSHLLLDPTGEMGRAYNAKTTPHLYIIDNDEAQTLVYAGAIDNKSGTNPAEIDEARNFVSNAMAQLDAGEDISPAQTKPYGCSIKYAS